MFLQHENLIKNSANFFIEEQKKMNLGEPRAVANRIEQLQRLVHTILNGFKAQSFGFSARTPTVQLSSRNV